MSRIINFILLIITIIIIIITLCAPGNHALAVFRPNEATTILQTFYQWLTPADKLANKQQKPWIDAVAGWEEVDKTHCGVFEEFAGKQKQLEGAMSNAEKSLKKAALRTGLETVQTFIDDLLGKISEKIELRKSLKKDQALLVLFREVFSIGKQLTGKLLEAEWEWEKEMAANGEKEKMQNFVVANNEDDDEQKPPQWQRGFAYHKYMQLELFFTKCALRMHTIEPYFHSNINVQWRPQPQQDAIRDADSDDGILTRDLLSMDQAAGVVAILKTFFGSLCNEVGKRNNKDASSGRSKTVVIATTTAEDEEEESDIDSLYECVNAKNGVQFANLFELFTAEVKKEVEEMMEWQNSKGRQKHLSSLGQELLLYELQRIRQRLEDIERGVQLTEQKKVRALLAAMAKYGANMVGDLVANLGENQPIADAKSSTTQRFLLDKYHYADMAEWFEAVHKKMKRHIKYHVNAIVYAPNGIQVLPLRTPKIHEQWPSRTIDDRSIFLKKIELTADVQLITTLIEHGQQIKALEEANMCAELEKLKQILLEKHSEIIAQVMEELENGLFIEQLTPNDNELLQCKLELTAIYGTAIESASDKFASSVWHRKAANELETIIGCFWGLHLAESSVAKALSVCGRKATVFHQKTQHNVKSHYEKEKDSQQQLKKSVEQIVGEECKISNSDEAKMVIRRLKTNLEAAMMSVNSSSSSHLFKKIKLNTKVDQLSGKFVKLEELQASLERVLLLSHTEHKKLTILQSDAKLIREAVHVQVAELKIIRQIALEKIRKAELDAQLGAIEKRNVIELGNSDAKAVLLLENFKFGIYDQEGKPSAAESFWKNNRHIQLPGELRLISGTIRLNDELLGQQQLVKQSFMATAKFSFKICLFWPVCFFICENGELGKTLDNSIGGIMRLKGMAQREEMIRAEIKEFKANLKCSIDFLFHKEVFDLLDPVAFTDRFFRDIFAKQFGKNATSDNLEATVNMAGLLELEEGFIEMPSLLSKNIWIPKKNAKFWFGIAVFAAEKETAEKEQQGKDAEKDGQQKGSSSETRLFEGKPIVSLRLPATDFMEMRLLF